VRTRATPSPKRKRGRSLYPCLRFGLGQILGTTMKRLHRPLCGLLCLLGLIRAAVQAGPGKPATRLGIEGTHFTLNDRPAFLLGISYYGALGAPKEAIERDLAEVKSRGFNWVRVWATWAAFDNDVSAVDAQG